MKDILLYAEQFRGCKDERIYNKLKKNLALLDLDPKDYEVAVYHIAEILEM